MAEATGCASSGSCFERATEHVASHLAVGLPPDKLLQLYGLYKQAICGSCNVPRPSWYQVQAKQKWDSWNALGDMLPEAAMEQYVKLVKELDPLWDDSSEVETKKHTFGWVSVSCMQRPDEVVEVEKTVFDWVKENNVEKLKEYMNNSEINADVNCRDTEGMGLIHWAADRGHLTVLRLLVADLNADVDLRDLDGQTALHYAASCDHRDVVEFLLVAGASPMVTDNNGVSPLDVAGSKETANLFNF